MCVHLAVAGPWNVFEGIFLDPVFRLRAGRELPRPPSWNMIDGALQAVAEGLPPWWRFPALNAVQAAVPLVLRRRDHRHRGAADRLVAAPSGQLDPAHVRPAVGRTPRPRHPAPGPATTRLDAPRLGGGRLVVAARRGDHRDHDRATGRVGYGSPQVAGIVAVSVLMFVVAPFFTYRNYLLHTRVSIGDVPLPFAGRTRRSSVLVRRLDGRRRAQRSDRRPRRAESSRATASIVGPADLSRTIYSDVAAVLPVPRAGAGHLLHRDGSGPGRPRGFGAGGGHRVGRLARADQLLDRAGSSRTPRRSTVPRRPTRRSPTTSASSEQYDDNLVLLFERCEGGGGVSPADVPGKYPLYVAPEDLPR